MPERPAKPKKTPTRIVGLDAHPDIFSVSILTGRTNSEARITRRFKDLPVDGLVEWATNHLSPTDLVVLEAGSNSFEIVARLEEAGFRAIVLESQQVGKTAEAYLDNDLIASERIARAYLTGISKAVWVADALTRELREILHLYLGAKRDETRAVNELRGLLNQYHVRPGKRNVRNEKTRTWVLGKREWTARQLLVINDLFDEVIHATQRAERWHQRICQEVVSNPSMLACLRVVGIGVINAFAIVAVVGDIRRFSSPQKLVAYLGLNPGLKQSGKGKRIKIGVGRRGRKEMRTLLIQAAQCVMRAKNGGHLRDWGQGLFVRKGNRNTAVAAVARRLAMQLWHLLMGHGETRSEQEKPLLTKLGKICRSLGSGLLGQLALPEKAAAAARELFQQINQQSLSQTA